MSDVSDFFEDQEKKLKLDQTAFERKWNREDGYQIECLIRLSALFHTLNNISETYRKAVEFSESENRTPPDSIFTINAIKQTLKSYSHELKIIGLEVKEIE